MGFPSTNKGAECFSRAQINAPSDTPLSHSAASGLPRMVAQPLCKDVRKKYVLLSCSKIYCWTVHALVTLEKQMENSLFREAAPPPFSVQQ